MYGYKATHKYYEDGREHTYHYVPGKNEAMSMAKSAILQKEFRNERKMLDVSYRMFRFMVNPKQALIAEANACPLSYARKSFKNHIHKVISDVILYLRGETDELAVYGTP